MIELTKIKTDRQNWAHMDRFIDKIIYMSYMYLSYMQITLDKTLNANNF